MAIVSKLLTVFIRSFHSSSSIYSSTNLSTAVSRATLGGEAPAAASRSQLFDLERRKGSNTVTCQVCPRPAEFWILSSGQCRGQHGLRSHTASKGQERQLKRHHAPDRFVRSWFKGWKTHGAKNHRWETVARTG